MDAITLIKDLLPRRESKHVMNMPLPCSGCAREFGKVQTFIQGNSKLFSSATLFTFLFLFSVGMYNTQMHNHSITNIYKHRCRRSLPLTLEGGEFSWSIAQRKRLADLCRHVILIHQYSHNIHGVSESICFLTDVAQLGI